MLHWGRQRDEHKWLRHEVGGRGVGMGLTITMSTCNIVGILDPMAGKVELYTAWAFQLIRYSIEEK